jgi:hypothetical protein
VKAICLPGNERDAISSGYRETCQARRRRLQPQDAARIRSAYVAALFRR